MHYTASLGSKLTIWQCVLQQFCDVLIWISSYNQLTWIDIALTVQLEMMFTVERTPWALPLKPQQVLLILFLHRCNKNMQTEIAVSHLADKTHIRSSRCHFFSTSLIYYFFLSTIRQKYFSKEKRNQEVKMKLLVMLVVFAVFSSDVVSGNKRK